MLNKDGFKNIIESHRDKVSNQRIANMRASRQFGRLLESDEIDHRDISFRALMEACLEADGFETVPSNAEELKEAVSTSAFPAMSREVISDIMIPEFELGQEGLSQLYTEYETDDMEDEKLEGLTGTEGVKYVAPQEPYESSTFGEKTASISVNKFSRTIELPLELVMADKNNRIRNKAANIGEKFGQQFEQHLIETL